MGSSTKQDKASKKEAKKERKRSKKEAASTDEGTTQPVRNVDHVPQSPKRSKKKASSDEDADAAAIDTEPAAIETNSSAASTNLVPPSPKPKPLFMPRNMKKAYCSDSKAKHLLYWCVDFPEKPVHKMFMATPLQGTAYLTDSKAGFRMPFMNPADSEGGRNELVQKSVVAKFAPDMDNIYHNPTGHGLFTSSYPKSAFVYMGHPSEEYPDVVSWTNKLAEEIVGIMNAHPNNKTSSLNYFKLKHYPKFENYALGEIVPRRSDLVQVIKFFFNPSFPPFHKDPRFSMKFDEMVQNRAVIHKIFGPHGNAQMLKDMENDIKNAIEDDD